MSGETWKAVVQRGVTYAVWAVKPDNGLYVASYCTKEHAELMAAAPDLLAVVKEALDSRAPDYADAAHPGWYKRALAAVAKAESSTGSAHYAQGAKSAPENET